MGRVSFEELLCDLDLYDYDYTKNVIKMPNNEQEAVLCLQLNINMILYAKNHKIAFDNFAWDSYKFFMETQKKYEYIINKAGLQLIRNSKKNYMMIVPRDEKVRSVAETTDNDTAILLYEFTSPTFKGKYKKKREILKLLANKIEPICKKYRTIYKSGLGFNIFNDLGTILNNFEIRHSNLDPNDVNNFKEPLTKYTSKDWEEFMI